MSRVLVFRHVPSEHLGLLSNALEQRRIAFEYIDLYRAPETDLAVNEVDALIFMGGPMSANDDLAYLRWEIECIANAISLGKPVLGVCLGAQLIAKALGAKVYPNPVKEIGWGLVHWTEAAGRDRLFAGLSKPELVFQWHGETFELPAGAELLAWSDACRNQAFRYGHNVYGLQFHLEVTPEMIVGWCTEDGDTGELRELPAPINPYANAPRVSELATTIFARWCRLVDCEGTRSAAI